MLSTRNRGGAVKAEIPQALYMSIVRLQATETLGWENACARAAVLLDANSQESKRAVELEAQRLYKVRFMKELNKARDTIRDNAWGSGAEHVRKEEDNFRVPCSVCGKPMYFSTLDSIWDQEKAALYETFKKWHHTTCAGT